MSRYIKADAIDIRAREGYSVDGVLYLPYRDVRKSLDSAPSIDIVRCQDCRYRYMDADLQVWTCTYGLMIKPDGFCNYGERKESE